MSWPTRPTWLEMMGDAFRAGRARKTHDVVGPSRWTVTPLRHALHWAHDHSGVPIALIAAVIVVVAFRVAKRTARFLVEIALALVLVIIASKLGWIHW